ncbi:MAG: hypothetical protein HQM10_16805 [Candidatus Riflebacteria bacterium]|nr:hypothetical protein [Candidatus Riflebacteria bacterium]
MKKNFKLFFANLILVLLLACTQTGTAKSFVKQGYKPGEYSGTLFMGKQAQTFVGFFHEASKG